MLEKTRSMDKTVLKRAVDCHLEVELRVHPEDSMVLPGDDKYLPDGEDISFPGPLMRGKTQMDDLIRFIQRKSQECLQRVDQPDQTETYFFWSIMEMLCTKSRVINDRQPLMAVEFATLLFKGYGLLRNKLRGCKNDNSWCLQLAQLLCSSDPDEEILNAVADMGQNFGMDQRQRTDLGSSSVLRGGNGATFDLIGCSSLPVSRSALREAVERTEVYEYLCFLTTGKAEPNFQIYKCYHASKLDELGLSDQAFDYCKIIARAIATFPQEITRTTLELTIAVSERLHQGKEGESKWLMGLRQLHADKAFMCMSHECGLLTREMFRILLIQPEGHTTPWDEFASLYTRGELLGEGGFGSVYAGVHKVDGMQVAIKYMAKRKDNKFITIPGETQRLPLEVALMEMVSWPLYCKNMLELIEWFEMSDCYILILERPMPCMDLYRFLKAHGRLSEPVAKDIMRQVVQAARHCFQCGVLHRDIKTQNLLINPDTLEVKLIDFGCGDLVKDTPYRYFAGTFCPPEWYTEGQYFADSVTVRSLGILLCHLVTGFLPFRKENDIIEQNIFFAPGLSADCHNLIFWCLAQDAEDRPTFGQILSHKWFTGCQDQVKEPETSETPAIQPSALGSQITPWEVFETLYTPGEMIGEGGYGTVCGGVRKADGRQVAIKYVGKTPKDKFITIPGETQPLPREVALMKMVSKPFQCPNVLDLIEWFEMTDCYILILDRPSPCMDLSQFLKGHNGGLSEPLAQNIMRQVVLAARHCCDCGVLHRDIKAENLLINTDTLRVKLIDFGCGDLLKKTPYEEYDATWAYSPPEWVCEGEYLGRPATMWSLGVLLFYLVCGYLPFHNEDEIVYRKMRYASGLSEGWHDLIERCLDQDPESRPTFEEILGHKWFQSLQN